MIMQERNIPFLKNIAGLQNKIKLDLGLRCQIGMS